MIKIYSIPLDRNIRPKHELFFPLFLRESIPSKRLEVHNFVAKPFFSLNYIISQINVFLRDSILIIWLKMAIEILFGQDDRKISCYQGIFNNVDSFFAISTMKVTLWLIKVSIVFNEKV